MANNSATMANLDQFFSSVVSKEPSVRLECFPELELYLSDENTSIECEDMYGFIAGLLKWVEGSNYRIAQNGLRILEILVERFDSTEFEHYVDNVVTITVDRLGDSKDPVREAAGNLLIKLMTTFTPQRIWDLMQPLAFDNKQFRIKEEIQRLLVRTLNEYVK